MPINSFFGRAFCINLKEEMGRLSSFTRGACDAGIMFERFEAIPGACWGATKIPLRNGVPLSAGQLGCILSHRAIIQRARAAGWPSVLIFEDDAVFHPEANCIFDAVAAEIPAEWDMLYLGGHHRLRGDARLVPVDPSRPVIDRHNRTEAIVGLYRTTGTKTTHAYGVSAAAYDLILDTIDIDGADAPVDVMISRLHPHIRAFSVRPHIAWQPRNFSSTEQRIIGNRENNTRWG